jgi:hypothetical protein
MAPKGKRRKTNACLVAAAAAALAALPAGCVAPERAAPADQRSAMSPAPGTDPQELQSTVMSMSDDWNTALGESMVAIQSAPGIGIESRINGLAFLRNGMGASLDIAVGPNPRVSMLDLLVLAALQEWALEHTWAGHGIPPGLVGPAKARLTEARREMASKASRHLTETQLRELDRLVSAWIEAHPRQVLVSFVRLSDFGSDRNELTLEDRRLANGLLKEVDQVTSAIDDARLLGERALWYAARYPFVVGQQAELTSMRVTRIVSEEAAAQREAIFSRFSEERERTMQMIETSRNDLVPVLAEARRTIAAASALSEQLRGVVAAVDGLVARFDHPEGDDGGLTAQDIKDILREAGESADKLSALVKASDALVQSRPVGDLAAEAGRMGTATVDRLLWGSAGIVALLVGGLAMLRLVPQRIQRG